MLVNFIGAPGSGKSTLSAGLFHYLKSKGIEAELITEFAKDMVYEDNVCALKNQLFILGNQHHRTYKVLDYSGEKPPIIINDAPIFVGLAYIDNNIQVYDEIEKIIIKETKNFYNMNIDTLNIFVPLNKERFSEFGRLQTYEESKKIESFLFNKLKEHEIQYETANDLEEIIKILRSKGVNI